MNNKGFFYHIMHLFLPSILCLSLCLASCGRKNELLPTTTNFNEDDTKIVHETEKKVQPSVKDSFFLDKLL